MADKHDGSLFGGVAQGTIEYVVLLAIIVVIGLVVVVLASGFVESGPGVTKGKSELYWSSQDVGIVDSVVDSNGDAIFRFANNGLEDVTITGLSVDGVDANVSSTRVLGGGKVSVSVGGLSACIGGSRSYVIKITYRDQYGIQHTVSGGELVVNCTTDVFRDVVPPVVSLISPSDGSVDEDGVVGFVYSVSDDVGVSSCELIIDGSVDQPDSSAPFGSFDKNFVLLGEGVYSWNVSCVDGGGNSADSNNGPWDVNYDIFEDGSYVHPFLLSSCIELQDMNNDLDANYALSGDIDCSDTINWNDGNGFAPVGNNVNKFIGSLDGRNHSISSLYINRPATNWVGLFGYIDYSEVKDLGMVDSNITGRYEVGGIAGENDYSQISNCYNTGTITGDTYVGGITGDSEFSLSVVSDSYNTGTITAKAWVGGIAGVNYSSSVISNSYNTGTVTATEDGVGGITGTNEDFAVVNNSYNTGTINGYDGSDFGGIAGSNEDSSIVSNSYNTGTVNGYDNVGGITGGNYSYSLVYNSYNTGTVTGSGSGVGGIAGDNWNFSVVNNSYNTGTITGDESESEGHGVGGIAGENSYSAIVSNSYNTGTINSIGEAGMCGGIVGDNSYSAVVSNSYNTGIVTGAYEIGGLIGVSSHSAVVSNSYNTGTINGIGVVGGAIGGNYSSSIVRNSFSVGTVNGTGDVNGVVGYNSWSSVLNLYWLDLPGDNATACYYGGDANCTKADAASDFYSSTYGVYTSSPIWNDGNWVWSGTAYPALGWQ